MYEITFLFTYYVIFVHNYTCKKEDYVRLKFYSSYLVLSSYRVGHKEVEHSDS